MKVLKFGGTSLGSPERMRHVAQLILAQEKPVIAVLSAVSGTTNALVDIANKWANGQPNELNVQALENKYHGFLAELFQESSIPENLLQGFFDRLKSLIASEYSSGLAKELLTIGELISTNIFYFYLREKGISASLINAEDFMYLADNGDPDLTLIGTKLSSILQNKESDLYITQGFICRNARGKIDNLQRGGSDYSATLIGAALKVSEVQIWTDIDGMHNNDPRIVDKTMPISELSFEEASELAYFGAKILHPYCIIPAQAHAIPVRIKNTLDPEASGTYITAAQNHQRIKAIAAKDGITAIKVKSSRMINAYGFLRRVFEVFENFKTPIDMITTSEIAISLTIDDPTHLDSIVKELEGFGKVEVDRNQTIICIVGDLVAENKGAGKEIFTALEEIQVRMISYGGSRNNISVLVDTAYKKQALVALNEKLFELK